MTFFDFLILVWLHFLADFILQSHTMATNKSTSNLWLSAHVLMYTIVFSIISPLYAFINGVLHFITDFTTSRITTYYYKKNNMSMFFNVIGFDQAIHLTCLAVTYHYLIVEPYQFWEVMLKMFG